MVEGCKNRSIESYMEFERRILDKSRIMGDGSHFEGKLEREKERERETESPLLSTQFKMVNYFDFLSSLDLIHIFYHLLGITDFPCDCLFANGDNRKCNFT